MIIPNSISCVRTPDFILWSGKYGDAIMKRDGITLMLSGIDEFDVELTVDNVQMALWAIE